MGKRNRDRRRDKQRKRSAHRPPGSGGGAGDRRYGGGPWSSGPEPVDAGEAVDYAVEAAAWAFAAGDERGCRQFLDVLGLDGSPGVAPPALVHQVIERVVDRALGDAWDGGWQPADVDRVVRKRHRSVHGEAVVRAIARQHRRYAAATIDPLWRDQLRFLGADPWGPASSASPEPGALPLGDEIEKGLPTSLTKADQRALIEILVLLWRLPRLPRLLALPGQATGSPGGDRSVDARVLERVRALLAKAESTTFAEEAEAFTAKAQELMARHAVNQAMIEGEEQSGGPQGRRIGVDDPYAQAKSLLLSVVASANRSRSVWSKDLGFSTVFGHESDLAAVDLLYTSLLVQANAAMAAAGRRVDRSGRSRTRSFRSSFLVAYANRIGQRLEEIATSAEAVGTEEHGAALLPVLVSRRRAVDDAVETAFPGMDHYSLSASNGAGWAAGTAAADLAKLSANAEVRSGRAS